MCYKANKKFHINTTDRYEKIIEKYFRLVTIDEYRTSCLDYENEMRVTNLEIEEEKLHSVLVFKTKNGSTRCMNHDLNGVRDIKKVI